jgi:hypothetical protein
MRVINKTMSTVTELQRARTELEARVVDLHRRLDGKHGECVQLKSELKREREAKTGVAKVGRK